MKKLNIFEKLKNLKKNKKIDKFNNITSAMFSAYLISTLKFEIIKYFWEVQKSEKIKELIISLT